MDSGRFQRKGEVLARRLETPIRWRTESGDVMSGEKGDWLVESVEAGVRTVSPEDFEHTYQRVARGRYRRVGIVSARQVEEAEMVPTREGMTQARPGMWIVTSADGASWPVPAEVFAASYEEMPDD